MWWLYILIGIVAIGAAALLVPIRLLLSIGEENEASLRILFIKKMIYPRPEPKKKKKNRKKPAEEKREAPKKSKTDNVFGQLEALKNILVKVFGKLKRHVKITLKKLHLKICTDEAARTAELYGAACILYDETAQMLRQTGIYTEKAGAVDISADFTFGETTFSAEMEFKTNLIGLIAAVLPIISKNIK